MTPNTNVARTDYRSFAHLSDDAWLDILNKSIRQHRIADTDFPRFPPEQVQSQFVGSSNEEALREAKPFYTLVKGYSEALGMPIGPTAQLLDFGCGWGRYQRFFARDFEPSRMFGVDIDPDIVQLNKELGNPGEALQISPHGRLPFEDNTFTHLIAYSVFTHLPERVHVHWLAELKRVSCPGAVLVCTLEPPRFLDFIASIEESATSPWHQGLKREAGDLTALRALAAADEFVYIPTGGGIHRTADIYGDAVITQGYVQRVWSKWFSLRAYIDDDTRFWQAVAVLQHP